MKAKQKFFRIESTSGKEIESEFGLMYGSPDYKFSIELDLEKDLAGFIKEQGNLIILSLDKEGLIEIEVYDDYRE